MNPTVLLDGARALRALPPPSLDLAQIPPLQHAAPPTIGIAMPDGSQTELPGALWPEPDLWAACERRARAGAPPAIEIRRLTRAESNVLAADWHPLGAETRPFGYHAFALFLKNEPVALASAGSTHSAVVDTDRGLHRRNVIELTRLCRSPQQKTEGSLRVMLRLWRDFLALPYWPYFPDTTKVALVSYSMPGKAGHIYRHDGWVRVRGCSGSGGGGTWSKRTRPGRARPSGLWVYWLTDETPALAAAAEVIALSPPSARDAGELAGRRAA